MIGSWLLAGTYTRCKQHNVSYPRGAKCPKCPNEGINVNLLKNFVWPSDVARAEDDQLNDVCNALEEALDMCDELNKELDELIPQAIDDCRAPFKEGGDPWLCPVTDLHEWHLNKMKDRKEND